MSVFELISSVQKKFENLDNNWIRLEPKDRSTLLSDAASRIAILQKINSAEDECLGQKITFSNQQTNDSKISEKLHQCVKMLARSGRFDLNSISTYLDISNDQTSLLMEQWKSEKS